MATLIDADVTSLSPRVLLDYAEPASRPSDRTAPKTLRKQIREHPDGERIEKELDALAG